MLKSECSSCSKIVCNVCTLVYNCANCNIWLCYKCDNLNVEKHVDNSFLLCIRCKIYYYCRHCQRDTNIVDWANIRCMKCDLS